MARTPKKLQPLDYAIAHTLQVLVRAAEISQRKLASASGMSLNRVGTILRAEQPPATMGELDAIARAVGTTASGVIKIAEDASDAAGEINPDIAWPVDVKVHTDLAGKVSLPGEDARPKARTQQ